MGLAVVEEGACYPWDGGRRAAASDMQDDFSGFCTRLTLPCLSKALLASFNDTSPPTSSSNCFPNGPDPPSEGPADPVPFLTSPPAAHTCVTHKPSPSTRCLRRTPPSLHQCQRPCIPSKQAAKEQHTWTVLPHDRASMLAVESVHAPQLVSRGETCRSASTKGHNRHRTRSRVHGSPCEGWGARMHNYTSSKAVLYEAIEV